MRCRQFHRHAATALKLLYRPQSCQHALLQRAYSRRKLRVLLAYMASWYEKVMPQPWSTRASPLAYAAMTATGSLVTAMTQRWRMAGRILAVVSAGVVNRLLRSRHTAQQPEFSTATRKSLALRSGKRILAMAASRRFRFDSRHPPTPQASSTKHTITLTRASDAFYIAQT